MLQSAQEYELVRSSPPLPQAPGPLLPLITTLNTYNTEKR